MPKPASLCSKMAWIDILTDALTNSGIPQYPDKNLLKAAILLRPEERPNVPVRVRPPEGPGWEGHDPQVSGFWNKPVGEITINPNSKDYKNKVALAALLAHEGEHARRAGLPDENIEGPAYQLQLNVANRLNASPSYRSSLQFYLQNALAQDKTRK